MSEDMLQESVLRLAWEILPAEEQWNCFPDFRFQIHSWLNRHKTGVMMKFTREAENRERIKALHVVNDTAERGTIQN